MLLVAGVLRFVDVFQVWIVDISITISVSRSGERARARSSTGIRLWSAAGAGSGSQTLSKAVSSTRFRWGSRSSL